ncbi:sugar ABC transporter substrate-binding protein, partial [Streptomyces sp. SID3343]|uniref:ABC transporter substrate-binding protein n=1 Tax=Streptomyces sp. SID3343 TaxID=2690260 RepID=UPI00136E7251
TVVLALLVVTAGCGRGPGAGGTGDAARAATGPVDDRGLLIDKPYAGTTIRLLTCCRTVAQFAALRKLTDSEFTARTGIKVEWANIPWASFTQKVVAQSVLGSGSSDAVMWTDAFGSAIRTGLEPIDDQMRASGLDLDDFPDSLREAASAGDADRVYGIPVRAYAYGLFYRKDKYAEQGLSPAATWDEYFAGLDRLRAGNDLYPMTGQYGRSGGQNLYLWLSMLWSNGADLFDKDGKAIFDSPEAIEATRTYLRMIDDGYTPKASANYGEVEATQAVEQGRSNQTFTWTWHQDNFASPKKSTKDVVANTGFAPVPGFTGKPTVTMAQSWLAGVLKGSDHKGAAWEYIKWLTHPQTERTVALDKSDPATASSIVVHRSNLADPAVNAANAGMPATFEAITRNARTLPQTASWPQTQDALEVAINEMAHGKNVGKSLRETADRVDALTQR